MKFHIKKIAWALRAVINKPFWGSIGIPSYMGPPVFVEGRKRIYIGKYVRIFPGIRMEAIGTGTIEIGDNVAIEQNAHITSMEGSLHIGSDVTISANVCITNLDHEYADISKSVMDQGHILNTTSIGEGCFIGYGAVIQAGTTLGKHCIVGANAVVRGRFPDYCVIVGVPAKIVKKYNEESQKWERTTGF